MIALIQRVSRAQVSVDKQCINQINAGILLLLGVEKTDTPDCVERLAKKIANLRIFEDNEGKMNLSLLATKGELLVVSQFTLVADTAKGNRPGFANSAPAKVSQPLYNYFITHFNEQYLPCKGGQFGADMQVELVNDGPATFYLQI